ncbi:MAG: peptidoglycan-binding protein [Candidatus Gracilibacteria bacterium]
MIALFIFISFSNFLLKASAEETQEFIVTAYYSPLPDQEYYLKGNYEDEIKLNGRGIRGASGLEVFNGMLAGPSKYSFGTKMYLEGIGTGVIADRGGAIVSAGERGYEVDRIDVWMGYGDEGLKKALSWGKRRVTGKIIEIGTSTITNGTTSNVGVNFTSSNISIPKTNKEEIYRINVGPESSRDKIKKLQTKLKAVGIYKGEINGIYNKETINLLVQFQIDTGIIKSRSDYGAGYWGAKTREKFVNIEKEFASKNIKVTKVENKEQNTQKTIITLPKDIFTTYVSPESNKDDIIALQNKLKEMGLYNGESNGKYNEVRNILLNYQISKSIISNKNDTGAGYFGPKTRELLKKDYSGFLVKKDLEERDRRKIEEVKILAMKQANETIGKIGNPKVGETSKNVRELQKVLGTLGYFEGKDTAIYGEKTKVSVLKFQIDKKLVGKETDPGAGKVGDKTKEKIKNELAKIILEKRLQEEKTVAMNYKK